MDDITKLDLYGLLEVSFEASEQEIKKAYRKKALSCHPDKNPDNPKAAELFHQLSKALEVLVDTKARNAYNRVLKARKATEIRNRELDTKRRKLKEDLEAREKAANQKTDVKPDVDAATLLQEEIERLRREGCRQVEEEQELLRRQVQEEKEKQASTGTFSEKMLPRLKVRWKVDKNSESSIGYTQEKLREIFSKYGHVECVVVSERKSGRALIEFSSYSAAKAAVENESSLAGNRLSVSWVQGGRTGEPFRMQESAVPEPPHIPASSTISSRDYESLVLMKMRQAEERKKLIEEMMKEDEKS